MKLVTASNGKQTVKMSKDEWTNIGKTAGWDNGPKTNENSFSRDTEIEYILNALMGSSGVILKYMLNLLAQDSQRYVISTAVIKDLLQSDELRKDIKEKFKLHGLAGKLDT